MGFERIEKQSATDKVIAQMVQKISDGEWKAGDKLISEAKMCEAFGISRHTCRNVLGRLKTLGLIETRQGDGSYLKSFDSSAFLNSLIPTLFLNSHNQYRIATEFRTGVEVEAARFAAMRATQEQIGRLDEIVEKMRGSRGNINDYTYYDNEFHLLVAEAAHNPMYEQFMNIILLLYKLNILKVVDDGTFESHRKIKQAIVERDPDKAATFMRKHMEEVLENALKA